jgi:membrane protease YdiL (CAAX protease family)
MNQVSSPYSNPWLRLLTFFGFLCIGVFIGQLLITTLLGGPHSFVQAFDADNQAYKRYLFTVQFILASSVFIATPLLYWVLIEKAPISLFFQGKKPAPYAATLTIGLVGSFMFINTLFIYWNMHMQLPAFLKSFEHWAQAKEAELKALTNLLTTFPSIKDLGIALLVMAVLPAIGEELLFRGILQRLLYQATQHMHLAIVVSAFIFSAIHLQFYGFLPRFLLGVLFGYIYWWTKDLSLAILGHFFNNAFTLTMLFLQQSGWMAYHPESTQTPSPGIILLFSLTTLTFAKRLKD